jgi:hypothetical protein
VTQRSFLCGAISTAAAITLGATALSAQQKCPATDGSTMPLKYKGGPTVAAITACDLMTRLYIYSDDSMEGREAGTPGNLRATAYIEQQVRALGLQPAGDKGSYFMYMPVTAPVVDPASTIAGGGKTFHYSTDFGVAQAGADRNVTGAVVFGGTQGDTANALTADQATGKVVIQVAAAGGGGRGGFGGGGGGRGRGAAAGGGAANPLAGAAAVLTVVPVIRVTQLQFTLNDTIENDGRAAYCAANPSAQGCMGGGRGGRGGGGGTGALNATITPAVAAALLGKPADQAKKGDVGGSVVIDVKGRIAPQLTRSVVAILPGSDPKLKNEYIIIGGHSDHIGNHGGLVEHDSLKAYNMIAQTEGAERTGRITPNADQWVRINAIKDSLRKIYPARADSIDNGADDDGTGSVSVLEIAEAFAKGSLKPKRSLIFIWQTGEEKGLWGSLYFTNHPTVPRDSIVTDLNIDMVGRGEATDVTGQSKDNKVLNGNPDYLQLVGSRRLSTELGDVAEAVNKTEKAPLQFDYSMDADGHTQRIYCRSDHYEYARYGIPVIFFTTGGHADYHQVTDEAQYIRYEHMARVDQLIFDIALKVGNADHKPVVDKAKQDSPFGTCVQ